MAYAPTQARIQEFDSRLSAWLGRWFYNDLDRLQILAAGKNHFLKEYRKEFAGFGLLASDEMGNRALLMLWRKHMSEHGMVAPAEILDSITSVWRPPTQKEINEAWKIESASSPEVRRELYGDKTPQQFLNELIDEDTRRGAQAH